MVGPEAREITSNQRLVKELRSCLACARSFGILCFEMYLDLWAVPNVGQPAFGSQILHFLTLKIPRPGGRMGRSYLYEAILGLILVLRRMGHRVETASGRY
jgi:hypothetical protein